MPRSAKNLRKPEENLEEVGPPTLNKMKYYIDAAKACQDDLEQKGLWQAIPERRGRVSPVDEITSEVRFCALRLFAEQPLADGSRSTRLECLGATRRELASARDTAYRRIGVADGGIFSTGMRRIRYGN